MNRLYRIAWLVPMLVALGLPGPPGGQRRASAQVLAPFDSNNQQFELDESIQLDRADSKVLIQLDRVKDYLGDRKWDEAVDTLREVMETFEDKLISLDDGRDDRFVRLRDYGHLQLASLPAEALKVYRSHVDPVAQKWYEQGVAQRDRQQLLSVVREAFASSWGDDALMALGEMALESGDYLSARWYWERIIPQPEAPRTWPDFPDTDLDLAAVRARLVLVSILEGSPARAREELAKFARRHPDARGRLGGREVKYLEALGTLLDERLAGPLPKARPDWPTFAGSPLRNKVAPEMVDVAGVAWRIPLGKVEESLGLRVPDPRAAAVALLPNAPKRVAEDAGMPLSYHPLRVGNLILVNNLREILAVDVRTGKPAWGGTGPRVAGPAIYRAELEGIAGAPSTPSYVLGVPRCTMTVKNERLYARMGTAVTSLPQQVAEPIRPGYLVCLDLAAEGRLMWKVTPEAGWSLEGAPIADLGNVYVAMRRSDIRPQAHVACFDAQTGRLRWRRFVCGAETPARGMLFENTHNLLSLRRETIYYNTNLGAVAALSTRDGRLKWVTLYPRARHGNRSELAPHWQRDRNPCLYHRGTLIVAPADSPQIFALDAAGGQILWQTEPRHVVQDVVHLLGTTGEDLIASGHRLYWIGLRGEDQGRVKHVWPDGPEKLGYGRGVLAADAVLWPTREKIYVFDQKTAGLKKVIDLAARGITGGNLLVADGRLLIATGTELIALSRYGGRPPNAFNPQRAAVNGARF